MFDIRDYIVIHTLAQKKKKKHKKDVPNNCYNRILTGPDVKIGGRKLFIGYYISDFIGF